MGGCRNRGRYGSGTSSSRRSHSGTWVPASHNTWNGCVTDRDQNYDVQNTTPDGGSAKSFPTEDYESCPTPILPLTNNWTALNQKINLSRSTATPI